MDSRMKDLYRLMKTIDKLTDGQASVDLNDVDWDEMDTLKSFLLVIRPNGGFYKGGKFEFTVTFPFDYPSESPPAVWCKTRVYHPNIDMDELQAFEDTSSNVCLNLFDFGTWQSSYTLEVMVMGLVFLFHHPNLNDPLADGFTGLETEDEFAENVRKYLAGEQVNDVVYEKDFRVINGHTVENSSSKVSIGKLDRKSTSDVQEFANDIYADENENSIDQTSDPSDKHIDKTVKNSLLCENTVICVVDDMKEKLHTGDSVSEEIRQEHLNFESYPFEDKSRHINSPGCNSYSIKDNSSLHLEHELNCGNTGFIREHVSCTEGKTITNTDQSFVGLNQSEVRMNELSDENMNETFDAYVKSKRDGTIKRESSRDAIGTNKDDTNDDFSHVISPSDADVNEQSEMEYVCIDGEYILKPKSVLIEETGIRIRDDNDDDDDAWSVEEIVKELENRNRRARCSVHVKSPEKDFSRIPTRLRRCVRGVCNALTRVFRPCRH